MVSGLRGLLDYLLHLDVHLGELVAIHGRASYTILFAIVFAETGLVIAPFLPGVGSGIVGEAPYHVSCLNVVMCQQLQRLTATCHPSLRTGDSLLFATGALAASDKLNIYLLLLTYMAAAVLGDLVNYTGGTSE